MNSDHKQDCKPCGGDGKVLWFDRSGGSDWRICTNCDGTGEANDE